MGLIDSIFGPRPTPAPTPAPTPTPYPAPTPAPGPAPADPPPSQPPPPPASSVPAYVPPPERSANQVSEMPDPLRALIVRLAEQAEARRVAGQAPPPEPPTAAPLAPEAVPRSVAEIVQQASEAIRAQANVSRQSVLGLLRLSGSDAQAPPKPDSA